MKQKVKDQILWYLSNRNAFTFSGGDIKYPQYEKSGLDGLKAFYVFDSTGKTEPTKHPELFYRLLKTKASLNFQIKQWAESRADGSLPGVLFSKRKMKEVYGDDFGNGDDIETEFNLPHWVVEAVENQKRHYYEL